MKTKKLFLGMAIASLTVWSCQKAEITPEKTASDSLLTTEYIQQASVVDGLDEVLDKTMYYSDGFIDFFDIIRRGGPGDNRGIGRKHRDRSGFFSDCTNFQRDTVGGTITTTISFEDGCVDRDSNTLSGTAVFVKSSTEDGKSHSATFTDFTINGHVINGSKSHTKTTNANGNPEMTSTTDITVMTGSESITKTGNKVIEITAGGDTDTHQDDEYTTTGSSSFTKKNGEIISSEIIVPLVKSAACKYISQGVKQFSNNGTISTIDFGDGTCDHIGTLTNSEGVETEISLRKRVWKGRP